MKQNQIMLLLTLFACCFRVDSNAQSFNWQALNIQSNRIQGKLTGKVYYMPPEANSKHFYQHEWIEGSILLEDGDLHENVLLRYRAYGDELVVFNSNLNLLYVVDKEKVAAFTVNHPQGIEEFVKLNFNDLVSEDRFFEKLYQGKRLLLAYRSIGEIKTESYHDVTGRRKNTVWELKSTYYLYSRETGFNRIQPRRRSFLSLFPERKKEVRRIFRQINSSRLTEKDIIHAVELLDNAGFFL